MATKADPKAPKRRQFIYNNAVLEDPDPSMSDADVKKFYESLYPDLTTATMSIENKPDVKVIQFKKSVGTKG